MSFWIKLITCIIGLVGVIVCFINLPAGSYVQYIVLLAAAGAFVAFLLIQENVLGRFDRLRYNLQKKISL